MAKVGQRWDHRSGAGLLLAFALLATATLAACGQHVRASPAGQVIHDTRRGIEVELPPGWQHATASLTPQLADPREVLSVATFPLRYRQTGCTQYPSSALAALGPEDALVTLQERGLDPRSTWPDFPPRPAHFGPGSGGPSDA